MLQHVSDGQIKHSRHAAVDFQHRQARFWRANGGLIVGSRICVNVPNLSGGVEKDHIERDERIAHPERQRLSRFVYEEHALKARHSLNVHQTLRAFLGRVCHPNRK